MECSFFHIEKEYYDRPEAFDPINRLKTALRALMGLPSVNVLRAVMLARAVTRRDPLYASIDPDLAAYFR